jgi:hypothetical protein
MPGVYQDIEAFGSATVLLVMAVLFDVGAVHQRGDNLEEVEGVDEIVESELHVSAPSS